MKKFVLALFICLVAFVSTGFAKMVVVKNVNPSYTGTVSCQGWDMTYRDNLYDKKLTPIIINIDGVDYNALSLDVFNNDVSDGTYDADLSDSSTYVNNGYADNALSLGFAIYNLNTNWSDDQNFSLVQIMLWDTLYDYIKSENQFIDKNFFCYNVTDDNFNNVDDDVMAFRTPYSTFLLNSTSNKTFTLNGLYENFTVVTISGKPFLIKKVYTPESFKTAVNTCPDVEPIIIEKEVIKEVPVEVIKTVYVDVPVEVIKTVYVEVPVEKIVKVEVPVEKIVEVEVPVEVIKTVYVKVPVEVEKIVYVDKKKEKKEKKNKRKYNKRKTKRYDYDRGHGNDDDGWDEDNPGKSNRLVDKGNVCRK